MCIRDSGIALSRFEHARDLRIAAEVQDLLTLGERREVNLPVDDDVPHRNEVRESFVPDRGDLQGPTLVEELFLFGICLLYTSPSPRDRTRSRMPSSA